MKTVKYMHTLGGEPATYDGTQVCYTVPSRPICLADSLRQIRTEQKASDRWRAKHGFGPSNGQYSYRRVRIA